MSDNVAITPGIGTTIATDDVGGVQYQRVKQVWGADGVATDVSAANPLPVVQTGSPALPTGAATETTLGTRLSESDFDTKAGALTETAPATDTASSGLNGRLQRIAQRLTTLLGVFPTTIDTNSGNKSASTLRVVLATDQPALTSKLLVTPDANSAVNIAQINGATPLMGAGNTGTGSPRVTIATDQAALAAAGQGATGSAVPAGAVYKGGIAAAALAAAATVGNLVGAMFDKFGRQVMLLVAPRDLVGTQATTISASTSETTIVTAGAAGVFNDLVMLIISNTSASTNTRIDFRDATAGSILFSIQSNGGQPPVGFALPVPVPQTTAANNWTAQCATSTTDVRIYAVYAKNK